MANVTRYQPFGDIDDMFKGFFMRPVSFKDMPEVQMKVDIKENDGAYVIHADMPGVKKEDVRVTVDGNVVSIIAEVKRESEKKEGDKLLRAERYSGMLQRSFSLDTDVDESNAQAKYNDGVLELTLPKKSGSRSRQIAVN